MIDIESPDVKQPDYKPDYGRFPNPDKKPEQRVTSEEPSSPERPNYPDPDKKPEKTNRNKELPNTESFPFPNPDKKPPYIVEDNRSRNPGNNDISRNTPFNPTMNKRLKDGSLNESETDSESQSENDGNENKESETKKYEPNSTVIIDGEEYETDDNCDIYKKNGELLPNTTYERNGITYKTDENGRIVSWDGKPNYDPENERDANAQSESGGSDRASGDDGGHLEARILGGSSGNENIVPMRDTINRGDYKKSENEITEAAKQNKDVQDSGKITYDGDSKRPSKIERTYTIDGEKTVLKVDNVEGSKDLLDDVKDDISDEDMDSLNEEIDDMEEDGCDVSVTSVKKTYDADGNLISVTVGIRNETTGEKTYRTFEPKKEG